MDAEQAEPVSAEDVTEAVVLAGGLGTRLQSAVPDLPKPMAPVANRPFLAWLLDSLAARHIRRVILSVGYRHEAIVEFFGRRYGSLAVDYAIETEPLGTGGGAARALALVDGTEAVMMNGDTFQEVDARAMAAAYHARDDAAMVMGVREVADASRYGQLSITGNRVQGFSTRGRGGGFINSGVYVVPRTLFDRFPMPERFSFEHDFLEARIEALRPVAFPCRGAFIDIGVPASYREAQQLLPALVTGAS
jgi:D-glycero-alpha-D-manno-heptose 1-phosphate guanylyltransferase